MSHYTQGNVERLVWASLAGGLSSLYPLAIYLMHISDTESVQFGLQTLKAQIPSTKKNVH